MQIDTVESRSNHEGPAQAGVNGRQQPAAENSGSPFSHIFSAECPQPELVSSQPQSQMPTDAATTSLGTVHSRAWLLEWVANPLWWFANLLWWFANLLWWYANHMWQLVKPAASCEPWLENSSKPHGRVPKMDFDVFLNHRGPDGKRTFVAHLYYALIDEGLDPFLDKYSLVQGSRASESIDAALEMAKVHVAVVSKGYAESKYCLTELVAMLRSGKPVIPVYYDVEPAELCRVETGAFAKAFRKHRSREEADQVREWADALRELAYITGKVFLMSDYEGDEPKLLSEVVGAVVQLLPQMRPVQVEKYLVGLEGLWETCVSKVKDMSDTRSVLGLFGMGGVGKTCLARVVYNLLITYGEFKGACFLEIGGTLRSYKKHAKLGWLQGLQGQLLWDLLRLGKERQARQSYEYWFDKLSSLGPVLIGLDDIQVKDHFDKLIPVADALAPGSCIIVTSRNRHLCDLIPCNRLYLHKVTPLGSEDSLKLFNWHAFGDEEAPESLKASSSGVSKAYGGLPLALKVVGSGLCSKFSSDIWQEATEVEVSEYPVIRRALQWSYDHLSEQEKRMFVDIAFLFCGWKKDAILQILQSCKDCSSCCGNMSRPRPYTSLDNLIDKSLVTLDKEVINMHALIQELGVRIGEEEGSHLKMVKKFTVQNGDKVRALIGKDFELDIKRFKKMPKLHFLVLNECVLYGNSKDSFEEVRYLQLRNCTITEASKSNSHTEETEYISRGESRCSFLLPSLYNLVSLNMSGNSNFTSFEGSELALEGCPNLLTLNLSKCDSITTLPYSIEHLTRLQVLDLTDCRQLRKLPDSIAQLVSLQELLLYRCYSLEWKLGR